MRRAIRTIGYLMCGAAMGFAINFIWLLAMYPIYNKALMDKDMVLKVRQYVRPLQTPSGQRYCSSSSIKYKGHVYTLTNRHCCNTKRYGINKDEIIVGGMFERILHISEAYDVCVATSIQKDTPLRLAKKPLETLDKVLLIGYPRGTFLTPRMGHLVAKYVEVCLNYAEFPLVDKRCVPSNYISSVSYGGNSGSPVFNQKGEVVNLLYAGSLRLHTYGITVPYAQLKAALDMAVEHGKYR